MARNKCKNTSNKNQWYLTTSGIKELRRTLSSSGSRAIPQPSVHQFCQERAAFPGRLLLLGLELRFPFSFQYLSRAGLARSAQGTGIAEQLGCDPLSLHLHLWPGAIPQAAVHRSHQKREGLLGVLTRAYRSIVGTSSTQRQQDQLTLEITKWLKARSLSTEFKATCHHQNPVLQPQQVLDAPTHWKRKI